MANELKRQKLLIADFTLAKYKPVEEWLRRDAIETTLVSDPDRFQKVLKKTHFEMCMVNLLIGGVGPYELIDSIRRSSRNPDLKIVIVSKQVQRVNIENCIQAGAVDFVADPFDAEVLLQRVLYHLAPKEIIDLTDVEDPTFEKVEPTAVQLLVDGIELLSKSNKDQERPAFHRILTELAGYLKSNRTSLVIVDLESNTGLVYASSDDPEFADFPINLTNYPEILHVAHSGNVVLIDDVTRNVMTRRIQETVKTIEIGSVMVFPIRYQNEIRGVLTVRRPKAAELPSQEVLRVVHALANTMAAHSNVHAILRKIYHDYHEKAS